MQLHKVLIKSVFILLKQILAEQQYADKAIEKLFKANPIFGARDRAFIAETVYDIIRYFRLYKYCSQTDDDFWKMTACYFLIKGIDLPPWMDLSQQERETMLSRYAEGIKIRVIRESIPDWMDSMGEREIPELWDEEIKALNTQAQVVLRVNTLKTTREKLKKLLELEGIFCNISDDHPDALILTKRKNVFSSPLFKSGHFEIQDASSQQVAPFLEVQPGMRVIDACAGGGGKALHLASMMNNKGSLICLDTEQWKLDELKKRAKRNGVNIIETRLIENNKTIKRLYNSADRLLLDVPCSGMGVLRRNPDAKWKLNKEFMDRVKLMQREILSQYSKMIKQDGQLVYATCSIFPSENQQQVQLFLETNQQFKLKAEQIILPSQSGFDGFYMARLKKITEKNEFIIDGSNP